MSQSTTQLSVYELENGRDMSPLPEESKFRDSSGPLFSMYSKIAQEEDNKTAERWQKDADGILIFTGLFSAAVASLLSVSIQDIRQNPQDTSAFYLKNINQLLFDQSTSRPSIPSTVSDPPAFSPPTYAVWVNVLWFLSLGISITCAVMATMLQQWAVNTSGSRSCRYAVQTGKPGSVRCFPAA
ncbi:hypothetical protein BC826DRAFT_743776 [Russula brevipes]|nr:hypothetical protein BC826DRAFT_743776 [Russula brevipes]